jgi:uncharacterized protein YeaO (DUF488 family)
MTIKLKSLRQSQEPSDGFRILITRFRPRYIKKENESWDAWYRELAPSRQLWHDYFTSAIPWFTPPFFRIRIISLRDTLSIFAISRVLLP